jgi:hypothetical protein
VLNCSLNSELYFLEVPLFQRVQNIVNDYGYFDKELLNTNMGSKIRTTSFDLIAFKINQPWDNGVGYDYDVPILSF